MRKLIALFFLLILISSLQAQILKPAKLETQPITESLKVGDEVDIVFKATIQKDWYMYTTGFEDCGPIHASVELEGDGFEKVGDFKGINDKTKHDEIFDCDVRYFITAGEFRQRIKITKPGVVEIKGTWEGQACSNLSGQCVQVDGDVVLPAVTVSGKVQAVTKNDTPKEKVTNSEPATVSVPETAKVDTAKSPQVVAGDTSLVKSSSPEVSSRTTVSWKSKNRGPIINEELLSTDDSGADSTILGYMIVAFILGLTSLITPCVFPMIPMTVTFFLKEGQSKGKGIRMAILFGISIIVIYTIVGTLFAFIFGPEGLNALATHWLPNLLISALFIVFALSFLGLFEINAPYQLVNKADRAAEKGGYIGIFFMSATLVLVSFSCTIPLVGNVLVLAAGGQIIKPILGMFAYSFAFAVPFTLFAMFPEWLKSMPKSGGWLNTVKVTLGLLELALALKFFSIADQTYHWGLLDRDVNIALWIVIFSFLGFYLLGKIRLKSDTVVEKINVARLLLSIAVFSVVIYLVPGLWGAPLKALAGYLPPMHTHDFDLLAATRRSNEAETCGTPKYGDFLHLPHGLQGYFDYDQAIECARQQNKPLFIDFTGHGCTNCREMEAVVWSDPAVLEILNNDYVIVALYIDDKTELPKEKWYTGTDGKVKKTMGKQNADLQITNLDNNAQPFYVLVGTDEQVLVRPRAYDRSVEGFVRFLNEGKEKFAARNGQPGK